jgi:hypothetical protein
MKNVYPCSAPWFWPPTHGAFPIGWNFLDMSLTWTGGLNIDIAL